MRAFALLLLLSAPAVQAQVGIGGLLGDPTGVTVKLGGAHGAVAVDVGLRSDLFVQAHYLLRERRVQGTQADIRFYYGPGAFFQDRSPDFEVGLSAVLGLNIYLAPEFELFGQLGPRVRLSGNTGVDAAGAVGLRFYP